MHPEEYIFCCGSMVVLVESCLERLELLPEYQQLNIEEKLLVKKCVIALQDSLLKRARDIILTQASE